MSNKNLNKFAVLGKNESEHDWWWIVMYNIVSILKLLQPVNILNLKILYPRADSVITLVLRWTQGNYYYYIQWNVGIYYKYII